MEVQLQWQQDALDLECENQMYEDAGIPRGKVSNMSSDGVKFLTPGARMVQGSIFEPNKTDHLGAPLVVKTGPNTGQPRVDYYYAVAIPKTDPGWPAIEATIKQVAAAAFPQFFPQGAQGACINKKFAWKYLDGDSTDYDDKGNRPCDKEGFPGHWILKLSRPNFSKCYKRNPAGALEELVDPTSVKRGDYIQVQVEVKGNGQTANPGVYLNHLLVQFLGYGAPITSGPDASAVFGATPAAMPAGASSTPVAGAPIAAPVAGGVTAPAQTGVAVPATPAPTPPAAGVQPATDFLTPPAAGAPPAPAPAVVSRVAADGVAYTEAQLTTGGYTPEQIAALPVA